MKNITFAVIGAGAGGLAMAGHLALFGHQVRLFNRSSERIHTLRRQGFIKLEGALNGRAYIEDISTEIEEIVPFAEVLLVLVPAYAHQDVAKRLAPFLKKGQIILLMPGRTGGAVEFAHTLGELGAKQEVTIAEAQTTIHTCRASEDGAEVTIFAMKKRVPVAAFPTSETTKVIQIIQPLFPQLEATESVLITSLGNIGAILHPTPTLLNIGWIETLRTQFLYYYEGITPSIAALLEELDRERIEVAKAFDVEIPSVQEWLYNVYGTEGESLYDAIQNNEPYQEIYAPKTINHRYIYEDIPTGLVPISSLGDKAEVETPNINVIVNLACKICGVNFWKHGRTVENLGLKDLSVQQIKEVAVTGYPGGKS